MKKSILTALLVAMVGLVFSNAYTIGEGSAHQAFIPTYGYYSYGWSRTLFTADEIHDAGLSQADNLAGLQFNVANDPTHYTLSRQSVYIRHQNLLEYSDIDYVMPTPDNFTEIFHGEVVFDGSGWQGIVFDQLFEYNGVDGLEILWINKTESWATGYPQFMSTQHHLNRACYGFSDYEPPPEIMGTMSLLRPNIRLITQAHTPPNPAQLIAPGDGSSILGNSALLQWQSGGGFPEGYLLYFGENSPPPFHADLSADTRFYPIEGLQEGVLYYWQVVPYNSFGAAPDCPIWSFGISDESFIELDDGIGYNDSLSPPTPYGTHYYNFKQHFLIRADEIYDSGGYQGFIESISFNVANLNGCMPMNDYRINLKHTELMSLSSSFEVGEYTQVFRADSFMPILGWNDHIFDAPFRWDGISNIIVEIVTSFADYTGQNASVYLKNKDYNSSLRFESYQVSAEEYPHGIVSVSRSNMRLTMRAASPLDLAAVNISGPLMPNVNIPATYRISVQNFSEAEVADYTVKIMATSGEELASVDGIPLQTLQSAEIPISWTPTNLGEMQIFGRVELSGDSYTDNNDSPAIALEIIPEGFTTIQLGYGTQTNTPMTGPTPYGTWYRAFRDQYLITAAELDALGGSPGFIHEIAFRVHSLNDCLPMPNYRIRMALTQSDALDAYFIQDEMMELYWAENFMPIEGWNIHSFESPFYWNGIDNLVIDITTNRIPVAHTNNAMVYQTHTDFASSIRYQADNTDGEAGVAGFTEHVRPNIRLFMNSEEMGLLKGRVFAGDTPLMGARVRTADSAFQSITNLIGEYSFYVPTGAQRIFASIENYHEISAFIEVSAGVENILDFNMIPLSNEDELAPQLSYLGQNYPNPFKNETNIELCIKAGESGMLTIYNLRGQQIYHKKVDAGKAVVRWDGKDMAGNSCGSGVYLYKLSTSQKSETKRMVLIR